jgi:hypothetical protein
MTQNRFWFRLIVLPWSIDRPSLPFPPTLLSITINSLQISQDLVKFLSNLAIHFLNACPFVPFVRFI